jgi:hypothetical protein
MMKFLSFVLATLGLFHILLSTAAIGRRDVIHSTKTTLPILSTGGLFLDHLDQIQNLQKKQEKLTSLVESLTAQLRQER